MFEDNDELLNKLNQIREDINYRIEAIRDYLKPFLAENQHKFSPKILDNFKDIDENCQRIKEKISITLLKETLINHNGSEKEYLLKIRHDMHNLINIVQAYTEVILVEFQKKKETSLADKVARIFALVREVLTLTNEIKPPQSSEMELARTSDLDLEVEISEYTDFKKTIEILVVDDLQSNCNILEQYLLNLGFQHISIARDGIQAIKKIKKTKFDIVLLDLDMPNMSGEDVLLKLKNLIDHEYLGVLVISGSDSIDKAIECIEHGAVDFITKPFDKKLLRVRINSITEKKWFKYKEDMYRLRIANVMSSLRRGYYLISFLCLLLKF